MKAENKNRIDNMNLHWYFYLSLDNYKVINQFDQVFVQYVLQVTGVMLKPFFQILEKQKVFYAILSVLYSDDLFL